MLKPASLLSRYLSLLYRLPTNVEMFGLNMPLPMMISSRPM